MQRNTSDLQLAGVFIGCVLASMLTLFLSYAHWWSKLFDPDSLEAILWLREFEGWPWIRLPILWTLTSFLVAKSGEQNDEVWIAGSFVFAVTFMLTYPGLETLKLSSDGSVAVALTALMIIHGIFVSLSAGILSRLKRARCSSKS